MSIDDQGMSRLNWVCRWQSGFFSAVRPLIHIFAGLKVCIQATRPMQADAEFASSMTALISSGVFTTGLKTSLIGSPASAFSALTIAREVGLDLPQRLGTVEVLAAGDEPDFEGRKIDHGRFSQNGFVCSEGVKRRHGQARFRSVGTRPPLPGSPVRPLGSGAC